ncbi:MAG: indolepyruvate ferredoxin oxidoreductase family protein [Magnetovibrionaceae bacterium]
MDGDLRSVDLGDKFTQKTGRIFLNGTQALVRLALMQKAADEAAGLKTKGYISGYRGSPLGNVDREMWRVGDLLSQNDIQFQPGVNEDLAATAVWGTQQAALYPDATQDGVFAFWYGKGPGVDRSGDVFRHGNLAGTSKHGGVLVLAGDDPACKSSTVPSQSEHAFMDLHMPVLNPANVQEVLDLGLMGLALSRYSGLWVAMKCITENMDSSASVEVDPDRVQPVIPADFDMPEGGLHIRWPDPPLDQEYRLQRHKIYAALAFARANKLNRVVLDSPNPRLGLISTGKSFLDVAQALDDLGIDDTLAAEIGLRVMKVTMSWPLNKDDMREFAEGLDEILVVEEKRAVIENQLKEQLYNWREDVRPRVIGKFDENGDWHLPSAGELTPARIARAIAHRIERFLTSSAIHDRLVFLESKERELAKPLADIQRRPYYCAGCPHNTSTKVPEGSEAAAGIGCHYMVTWMDRNTKTFTQMGGEGANWIGQSPFRKTDHIFVNLGDGTYFHSGLLAIRAAVSSGVNITYKILYNDAVAMTGGQPMDGPLDVPMITRQVAAEGVSRIVVVSDEPTKYPVAAGFAEGVSFYHRDDFEAVQKDMRLCPGVSVLVYDQTCAAEKRRRRKRAQMPDPPKRLFIHDDVCEGCGDCGVQSNCVAITPLETELGRKREIDQSACNKDYSCARGFCPSFVTVLGATPHKEKGIGSANFAALPKPDPIRLEAPYNIVVTGIGGTGVVTIGALLGMAAHLEGLGCSVLDQTGLAQKNGAVLSYVRIAATSDAIHAARVSAGGADLVLGCDQITAGSFDILAKMMPGTTRAVINAQPIMPSDFTQKPDLAYPKADLQRLISENAGDGRVDFIEAGKLATALLGDSLATNLFMLGFAYQKGLLPLSEASLLRAVELNGNAVDFNKQAFVWGRRAGYDLAAVEELAKPKRHFKVPATLEERIAFRISELTAYQDEAYAKRYASLVDRVQKAEEAVRPGQSALTEAVVFNLYRLMAIKDEYEVARLYTDGRFERRLYRAFDGASLKNLRFHLAPPLFAERDLDTGRLKKKEFGAWVLPLFKLLAKGKALRGGPWDVFGRTKERQRERTLLSDYEALLETVIGALTAANHAEALALADWPRTIRGFGHVREKAEAEAREALPTLVAAFNTPDDRPMAAE